MEQSVKKTIVVVDDKANSNDDILTTRSGPQAFQQSRDYKRGISPYALHIERLAWLIGTGQVVPATIPAEEIEQAASHLRGIGIGMPETLSRSRPRSETKPLAKYSSPQARTPNVPPGRAGSGPDAGATVLALKREKIAGEVLNSMSIRDREILTRFYLEGQPPDEICRRMNLTEKQFGLLKCRLKARFAELVQPLDDTWNLNGVIAAVKY